jgi:hypothetical protein
MVFSDYHRNATMDILRIDPFFARHSHDCKMRGLHAARAARRRIKVDEAAIPAENGTANGDGRPPARGAL